jgi:hypothetical protein
LPKTVEGESTYCDIWEHSLVIFRINCSQSSQPSTSLVYSDLFLAFTNFFE